MKTSRSKRTPLTEHPMSIRLPPELQARVAALVPQMGTQSAVLRVALIEGLKVLERRYGEGGR